VDRRVVNEKDRNRRCVVVCCSAEIQGVMQCVAVRCNVLQCVVGCCSVLQCVAAKDQRVIDGKK